MEALLDEAIDGHGALVGVVGSARNREEPSGRAKSPAGRSPGVEVFTTHCESHTRQVPFHVVARLLRAATRSRRSRRAGRPGTLRGTVRAMPTPKTCCSLMTCSGSRTLSCPFPRSIRTPAGGD